MSETTIRNIFHKDGNTIIYGRLGLLGWALSKPRQQAYIHTSLDFFAVENELLIY